MRKLIPCVFALLLTSGCPQKAPAVYITTVPPSSNDVAFNTAYEVEEGSSLDLVIEAGKAGSSITTSTLPTNSTFQNGIFSFTPDYTQSGLYSVTFTITSGDTVSTRTIGIRVLNVIHINTPALTVVDEGAKAPEISFASSDPTGTIVVYSADLSAAPGATFDPVNGKLNFQPSIRWLDSRSSSLAVLVIAEGQELDTGKLTTSTAKVVYQINEATSFKQEIAPLVLFAPGKGGGNNEHPEGHMCINCHAGSSPQAGMDFMPDTNTPNKLYDALVNHDVSVSTDALCSGLGDSTYKRVAPNDLAKSVLYWKLSGTDGKGGAMSLCGNQMPNITNGEYFLTTKDQDAWNACSDTACRQQTLCDGSDLDCKLNARYIRKLRVWIEDGAQNN